MASTAYQRLSALDRSFLVFEDVNVHMHLGGVAIFDARPLTRPEGGLPIERIRQHIASRLHFAPRYRQRLAWVPLYNRPVWVDDANFDVSYHVRHSALPYPGDDGMLKSFTARVMSEQLDRTKPLWEISIIEGLHGTRMAMLVKTHHAVADGISAFEIFSALVSTTPEAILEEPPPWKPQPEPTQWSLLRDELVYQTTRPLVLARDAIEVLRAPNLLLTRASEGMQALWDVFSTGFSRAPSTPLNQPIGRHRRFDWLALDLEEVKAVKSRLGGTVNDVVLTTVAGALRRFLLNRGAEVRGLEYRVIVPVSVRGEDERGVANNRASAWLLTLPVGEPDPRRRFELVAKRTAKVKSLRQELAPVLLERAFEYSVPGALTLGMGLLTRLNPYNLIVTNVAGPSQPFYFLEAPLIGGYPQVPLFENQGLSVAIFSYRGTLGWGFNADRELVPDLNRFVEATGAAFAELRDVAGVQARREPTADAELDREPPVSFKRRPPVRQGRLRVAEGDSTTPRPQNRA